MFRALLFVALVAPLTCWAEGSIYRTTDEHGNVVFTDAPPADIKGSERLKMGHINTTPPPEKREVEPQAAPETEAQPASAAVTITAPANETTIPNGPGNFSVSVRVKSELGDDANLQLFMDGVPWGEPQRSATWDLTNVFRGQHDLTVGLADASGEVVVRSEPIRVYVFRPSINNPGR